MFYEMVLGHAFRRFSHRDLSCLKIYISLFYSLFQYISQEGLSLSLIMLIILYLSSVIYATCLFFGAVTRILLENQLRCQVIRTNYFS